MAGQFNGGDSGNNSRTNENVENEPQQRYKDRDLIQYKKNEKFSGRGRWKVGQLGDHVEPINKGEHYSLVEQDELERIKILPQQVHNEVMHFMNQNGGVTRLSDRMINALASLNFREMTPIQQYTIPMIKYYDRADFLIKAQPSSGKTLAFLIPIIEKIFEMKNAKSETIINNQSPYAVILCPTRELAEEHFKYTRRLLNGFSSTIKCCIGIGKMQMKDAVKYYNDGSDILFCTLGRLRHYFNIGGISNDSQIKMDFKNLRFFVMDEISCFTNRRDDSHDEVIQFMKQMVQRSPDSNLIQTIAVGSGLILDHSYRERYEGFIRHYTIGIQIGRDDQSSVTTQNKIVNIINEVLMDRIEKLEQILEQHNTGSDIDKHIGKTLIFVNYVRSASRIMSRLKGYGFTHTDVLTSERSQSQRKSALDKFRSGMTEILVASDCGSSGLNIPNLEYVVNFELPTNGDIRATLINRIGRTGRLGNKGIAYHFYNPQKDYPIKRCLDEIISIQFFKNEADDENVF